MISNLACCLRDVWQKAGLQLHRLSGDFHGMNLIPLQVPLRSACKPEIYEVECFGGELQASAPEKYDGDNSGSFCIFEPSCYLLAAEEDPFSL